VFSFIPDDLNEEYLKKIYKGKIKSGDVDQTMWNQYFTRFRDAIGGNKLAINYGPDWEYNQLLLTHASSFSAFKNHTATGDLLKELIGDDGKIKPFQKFKADAAPYINAYNHNWLQSEYQTAKQSSRMALKWQQIQRRKDSYPNLEYVTQRDGRVRPEHVVLDKIIRSVDDPFWDMYYPPNGWRCRCLVRQTTDPANDIQPDGFVPDTEFNHNVGKTAQLWGKSHPYFQEAEHNAHFIEKKAESYYARTIRDEVRIWGRANLVGKSSWGLPDLPSPATITGVEIDTLTAKPHKNRPVRNQLLFILDEILDQLIFIGSASPQPGKHSEAVMWYYYKLTLGKDDYYFNFRERKKSAGGGVSLYAILDYTINK
jgi:SPP1 gp7 family putative phage head morphogenesis protein